MTVLLVLVICLNFLSTSLLGFLVSFRVVFLWGSLVQASSQASLALVLISDCIAEVSTFKLFASAA